jgi:hypothetical protein
MPPMCLYICVCSHAIGTFLLRSPLRAGLSPRRLVLTPFRQRANKTQREYARSVCLARTRRPLQFPSCIPSASDTSFWEHRHRAERMHARTLGWPHGPATCGRARPSAGLPCTKAARNESKKKKKEKRKKILQWKTLGSHFRQQFGSKHGSRKISEMEGPQTWHESRADTVPNRSHAGTGYGR